MKKISTCLMAMAFGFSFAQSTFNLYLGTTTNVPITNGSVISTTTIANSENIDRIKIKNMSAGTHTYNLIRTIGYNVPMLNTTGTTVTPVTYFCYGNSCFVGNTNTVGPFDYIILLPAGQTSTVFPYADNNDDNFQLFKIYLDEGNSLGKYYVNYKIFEVNNPNDTASFTIKYNELLNVNSQPGAFESISDVFPNPVNSNATININLRYAADVKITIFNSLGSSVYSGTQKCPAGKNKLPLDCGALNTGLYFININTGDSKITRRFIVNK